jgi:hypothetical protein
MLLVVLQSLHGKSPTFLISLSPFIHLPDYLHHLYIPTNTVFFHRSWFNHTGVREMYMNCAAVTITNGGSGLGQSFPNMFVANLEGSQCTIPEGTNVDFPNPGASVERNGASGPPNCN